MNRLYFFLLFAGAVSAQTLSVPEVTLAPGARGTLEVVWSGGSVQAVALQWDVEIPARFTPAGEMLKPGDAAVKAGKSVNCAGHWKKAPVTYVYRCIVSGGRAPLADGTVATLAVTAPAGGARPKSEINLAGARAVLADAKSIPVKNARSFVTVPR